MLGCGGFEMSITGAKATSRGHKVTTVYDVAKYIIDNWGPMSAMKLQKLVFYSQAMAMVWDDVPLFSDDFEAWAKGPVCHNLFNAHKGMFMLNDSLFLDRYNPDIDNISSDHKETIQAVMNSLADLSPFELSEMTHSEAPWLNARGDIPQGAFCDNVIKKEDMLNFYQENW